MTTTDNFSMNQLGEPDAGKPHVRFDERGVETELRLLRHASTLLKPDHPKTINKTSRCSCSKTL